ncbi:hypothetical protein AGR6A_pAt60008 [Agrobacterium sp. NCPPB 925]|nr:hypothetical protein AGR6A_pAt60008 [Agrobacterium sp. NCPPB 925]
MIGDMRIMNCVERCKARNLSSKDRQESFPFTGNSEGGFLTGSVSFGGEDLICELAGRFHQCGLESLTFN